jgi:hypothetical protein
VSHPNLIETEAQIAEVARTCRVVAVVGMKDETRSWEPAFAIPKMLVDRGIEVIPVNPTITQALDRRAYASLADVPDAFDLVDVFRRSDRIPDPPTRFSPSSASLRSSGCRPGSATTRPRASSPKQASRSSRTRAWA